MPRLVSRNRPIPNGLKFWQPEIKFEARDNMSFQGLVQALIYARAANPHLVQKHGWSLNYDEVANLVDSFNAKICAEMGWTDYITDGEPTGGNRNPFHQPPQSRPGPLQVAAGAKPVVEWLMSGAEAVPMEQANRRASTCVNMEEGKPCPYNAIGDWTRFFSIPVSEAIRAALNSRRQMKLATPFDEGLGMCEACSCPLKLKVHMPIGKIWPKLSQESKESLHPKCWILAESKAA